VGDLANTELGLLQPSELGALAQLHEDCFARGTDVLDLLRQRYGSGPRSEVIVARTDAGVLVGAQAMTWLEGRREGKPATLGMMTMGMVHPDFRRRGLFRGLVRSAAEIGREGGADVLFTMPNDRSAPAFARFEDWQDGGRRRAYLLPLDPGKLAGQRFGLGGLGAALGSPLRMAARWSRRPSDGLREVLDLARIGPALDALASRVAGESRQLLLLRDSAFANWRYVKCPTADYRFLISESDGGGIDGVVVTTTQPRFGSTLGFVVDILSDAPAPRRKLLLRFAARTLWEQGATAVVCVGRMDAHRTDVKKAGFIDVTAVYPRTFHTFYSVTQPTSFDPASDWYLTLADFDSV